MPEPMTDLERVRAAAQAETECGFDIQIGGRMPEPRPVDPIKLQMGLKQVKLHSLLFGELKRLLSEVDFGSGMEAAYTQGRQCIYERMQAVPPDQKASLDNLLTAAAVLPPADLQAQLRQQLYRLLTASDWQSITATALAAVESKLLNQVVLV